MSEYSEHPVFRISEVTTPQDELAHVQVTTADFDTTIVVTGKTTTPLEIQYTGYEGNRFNCPDETDGDEAILLVDKLQMARNRKMEEHLGRPAIGSLILISRPAT